MLTMPKKSPASNILGVLLALTLLLSACSVPAQVTAPTATQPEPTQAVPQPTQTTAPVEPTAETGQPGPVTLSVNLNGLAQNITAQVNEAVPSGGDRPWWETLPQHTVHDLQGYPISDHLLKPQIFLYPVADLQANETGSQVPVELQAMLESQQPADLMPYLPPYNAAQVMHAQVQFLDFKNGKGVRYLTQFDQGILPINNHEMLYTYQGLTAGGKYYVAVVLPVSLAVLPANENDTANLPAEFSSDFPAYLAATVDMLNRQPTDAFYPNLEALDTLVQTIQVQ